jgi:hypothetical protein
MVSDRSPTPFRTAVIDGGEAFETKDRRLDSTVEPSRTPSSALQAKARSLRVSQYSKTDCIGLGHPFALVFLGCYLEQKVPLIELACIEVPTIVNIAVRIRTSASWARTQKLSVHARPKIRHRQKKPNPLSEKTGCLRMLSKLGWTIWSRGIQARHCGHFEPLDDSRMQAKFGFDKTGAALPLSLKIPSIRHPNLVML